MLVALSTIPPRFDGLTERLAAILSQGPDGVVVTIPHRYERFSDWDGALPELPNGVMVLRGPDFGPASKFVAPFQRFPDRDVLICDDDCIYQSGWLDAFRAARNQHPESVIAASCFEAERLGVGWGLILQGFAGIMLRPQWLDPNVTSPDYAARWVDDIWLSAHIAASGRNVVICPEARACVAAQPGSDPLQNTQIAGKTRAELNSSVAEHLAQKLGIWNE